MEIKELIKKLENELSFKEWKKENRNSYLVHLLRLMDEPENDWQIGYYNKNDTITSFAIVKNEVKIMPEEEIFKKSKTKIDKLNITKVKIDFDKALEIATKLQQEKYKNDMPLKRIVVLQNLNNKDVWNITFVTQAFNTLNFKISCENGKIIEEKLTPLMSFVETKK